ncbi:MAG TPA: cytochrome P450, partial [Kofleriaceae bacterium]
MLAPLRVEAPVYHDAVGGRYVVTRHADVKALLANRELCVDPRKANPGTYAARLLAANGGAKIELSMIDMDAPDHRRVRSLVTKAFTVSAVEALRPKTRALAEQLLDAVTEPEFDFMPAFADPFPTTVIAEMLGIDPSMRDQFKVWSTITIERFDPTNTAERLAEIVAGEEGLRDLLFHEIAARRAAPRNDLIGRLAEAREGGERLTDKEIVAQCQLLLVAGNTTTSDLIGNGLKNLIERPEQLAYLRAHPDVLPNAVEEMLRYDPSVDCTRRIAHTDLEVAGCPIAKGEYIYLSIASANHDENLYTDPDRFDVRRPQIRHVAFGGGDHLCLGAPLARLEAQEAFRAILGRFRHIGLSPRGHRYRVVPNFRG